MSGGSDFDAMEERDRALLGHVEAILADRDGNAGSGNVTTDLCAILALSVPQADASFRRRLREQLLSAHPSVAAPDRSDRGEATIRARWLNRWRWRPGVQIAAAVVAFLILTLGVAVAQGRLAHVVPITLSRPAPAPTDLAVYVSYPTNVGSDAALQRLVRFPLLVPTDLPSWCPSPHRRAFQSETESVTLVYQCVAISERPADRVIEPIVDRGTAEDVQVNGQPALYYEQTSVVHVVRAPGGGTPTPVPIGKTAAAPPARNDYPDTARALVFERDGVILTLSTLPDTFSGGRASQPQLLDKPGLIRIAASMRRLGSP